jgi:hypothetical protein
MIQWCVVTSPLRLWPLTDCTTNYRPVLSSERAHQDEEQSNFPAKERKKKNLVMGSKRVPDTKTCWLTDSRKVTSTSTAWSGHSCVTFTSSPRNQMDECDQSKDVLPDQISHLLSTERRYWGPLPKTLLDSLTLTFCLMYYYRLQNKLGLKKKKRHAVARVVFFLRLFWWLAFSAGYWHYQCKG